MGPDRSRRQEGLGHTALFRTGSECGTYPRSIKKPSQGFEQRHNMITLGMFKTTLLAVG